MIESPEEITIESTDFKWGLPFTIADTPCETDKNYVKHVSCNGARFHVLWWDTSGRHCSEPKCIINKPKEEK